MLLPHSHIPPKIPANTTLPPLLFPFTSTLISLHPSKAPTLLRPSASTTSANKSAIQRISEKLRSLGYLEKDPPNHTLTLDSHTGSAGEIFLPPPHQLSNHRVGHTLDPSWSTPHNPVPRPGSSPVNERFRKLRNEVVKEKKLANKEAAAVEKVPTLAELSVSEAELKRIRGTGIRLRKTLKVGKAGITEGIVNGIHERWRRAEIVKIECEDLCRLNMKRTHDLLERKTGGLVVWRSGSKIILYRGANYKYPYFSDNNLQSDKFHDALPDSFMDHEGHARKESGSSDLAGPESIRPSLINKMTKVPLVQGVGASNRVRFQLPGEAQLVEEGDSLLDELGPRFTDWWGYGPLPVDGDLLPAIVPGYRRPFRLLPYGVKPKLTDDEMTTLRRLGRPLPCHFVLGRNRNLQGLAASIVKLWEKCEIAKIVVKRGVQNTNSELMAEELKRLTGGTLLSRDRETIVFYRGKDFLPASVSSAIDERRKSGIRREKQTTDTGSTAPTTGESKQEFMEHTFEDVPDLEKKKNLGSTEAALKRTSAKLSLALEKKARALKLLARLEKTESLQEPEVDKEGITEEERYMLRKVGLKMKPFLLLGRRGVFDGTIENMHLHWKYRELVKIICNGRSMEDVHGVARTLEAESGGILVAVERVSKGYSIIVYRGKNYERPISLRPQTLLNKRQALKRSVEAQRRESLKLHVLKLNRNIDELQVTLVEGTETNNMLAATGSNIQLAKEEMNTTQSARHETGYSSFSSSIPAGTQADVEGREDTETRSISIDSKDSMFSSRNNADKIRRYKLIEFSSKQEDGSMFPSRDNADKMQQDNLIESSSKQEDGSGKIEAKFSSESIVNRHPIVFSDMNHECRDDTDSAPCPDGLISHDETNFASANPNSKLHFNEESTELPVEADKIEPNPSAHGHLEKSSMMSLSRGPLSNKDRLLLRKQALRMKKRPVLAVGRSNIITGVAKTIKAHFKKHPLAIVNVKGRAKGTSVQEVVFKLEQATGGILVSQEPSKVILYRGWGATEQNNPNNPSDREGGAQPRPSVSRELMEAIRLECGLQKSPVEEKTA